MDKYLTYWGIRKYKIIIVNLSGRGDKDMDAIILYLENENK